MSRFCVSALVATALLLPGVSHAEQLSAWSSDPLVPRDSLRLTLSELQTLAPLFDGGRPRFAYKLRGDMLSIALEPGSPCTGACLTLVGWF